MKDTTYYTHYKGEYIQVPPVEKCVKSILCRIEAYEDTIKRLKEENRKLKDEVWKDELIYPFEYNYDEVRFIQWPDGKHWYAKIGKIDICDQWGNYKWSDKYYAMEIAKKWCKDNQLEYLE